MRETEQRGGAMGEWRTENKRREQEFGHRLPLSFVARPRLSSPSLFLQCNP